MAGSFLRGVDLSRLCLSLKPCVPCFLPNFLTPYDDALLPKLYFPIKIKTQDLNFWIRFLEKFGAPWAIGKTSDGSDNLAEQIFI